MEQIQGLSIVPLEKAHLEALAELEKECFSLPWSLASFGELLTHSYCHYLVALLRGEVVGMAGMVALAEEGDIDKVMVAPGYRSRGIAGALLDELMEQGKKHGITAYTLEVRVGNKAAIHLYEKMGFVSRGIRPGYYDKPREDALIMWKLV